MNSKIEELANLTAKHKLVSFLGVGFYKALEL